MKILILNLKKKKMKIIFLKEFNLKYEKKKIFLILFKIYL
jgi:hypothetical protein